MIFPTIGIVLKNVKYGETSGVVTIYTRQFGVQSYLVNGIRTSSKSSKAHLYQPASLLDLQVYHSELKNLQRIKEARWLVVYQNIFTSVKKNAVALFMVELLQKAVQHPEENDSLFDFCEETLGILDTSDQATASAIPLFFALKLPRFLGFQIDNNFGGKNLYFNLREGNFSADADDVSNETDILVNKKLSAMLKMKVAAEFASLKINRSERQVLLRLLEKYYKWHINEFSGLKTLEVFEQMD